MNSEHLLVILKIAVPVYRKIPRKCTYGRHMLVAKNHHQGLFSKLREMSAFLQGDLFLLMSITNNRLEPFISWFI